jgi:long-chain acyl-CoA synthetase
MPSTSFKSVAEMFQQRVDSTPDSEAMHYRVDDQWKVMSWREAGRRVRNMATGLLALGLAHGERCSILAATRVEWVLADMAILAAAGATTTIYASNTAPECAYIIENSGTVYVFVENETQLAKLLEVREQIPLVRKCILIEGKGGGAAGDWAISLSELEKLGESWDAAHPGEYARIAASVEPDDVATLIYTAGTTGVPKGVILTHDAWVYEGEAIDELGIVFPSDRQYLFLPLAHSFAKVMELLFIRLGVPTAVDGDMNALVDNLGTVRPTFMAAVPRVFEKVYNKVVANAKEGGKLKWAIFRWALTVGREVSSLRQKHQEPTGLLALKFKIADTLVFSKLKARFGGRVRFFISGGAPLPKEIAEFFHAADILILEGYGLTETSAATFVNLPEKFKFGTVGPALPHSTGRIAEDGEVLVKGRGVMKGYYNLPEDTKEAFTDDGFFKTGDIGIFDEEGYLRITDRKKDIIVTAGGKNVAPQNIENTLKMRCSYISQLVVHGDKRNFLSALVTISEDATGKWAREKGIPFGSYAELASRPEVRALIQAAVDKLNAELPSYETIKAFAILDHDLSQEAGELTPKLSIKRRVVESRYQSVLDGFYSGTVVQI